MQANQSTTISWPWMVWTPAYWFGAAQPAHASAVLATAPASPKRDFGANEGNSTASPVLLAYAQSHAEMMALLSRRAQAWMALPAQIAQCRAPQDVVAAQMQFWQTATQHHTDGAHRIAAAWSALLPAMASGLASSQPAPRQPQRDRMTIPEARETDHPAAAAPHSTRLQTDRRTAA